MFSPWVLSTLEAGEAAVKGLLRQSFSVPLKSPEDGDYHTTQSDHIDRGVWGHPGVHSRQTGALHIMSDMFMT